MYAVKYKLVNKPEVHTAVFDNLECAQLWWDSVAYLRNTYQMPLEQRPGWTRDVQLGEFE